MTRYKKLPGHKNVRKDLTTGKYQAYKMIDGKQFSQDFSRLSDAKRWIMTFNPKLNEEEKRKTSPLFKDVWKEYKLVRYSDLEFSTKQAKDERVAIFYPDLKDMHMEDIDADFFRDLILRHKTSGKYHTSRISFDKEIKEYKAIFHWYRDYKDYKFFIPITKFHKQLGKIKKSIPKNKKMSANQVQKFFSSFESDLFKNFAIAQFFCCARVSEIAGLQTHNIDLEEGTLLLKDVVVWNKQKKFQELKPYTKNNDVKFVQIVKPLYDILVDQLNKAESSYVFHLNGEPLTYRQIQHHYDRAFKKANLRQFSGTHTLRHSMASIARELSGSMDAVQSLTGHKSVKQAEHYAGLSHTAQIKALECVTKAIQIE